MSVYFTRHQITLFPLYVNKKESDMIKMIKKKEDFKMDKCFLDIATNIQQHVYDSDAVSSYPSDSVATNLSKTTTKRELIDVVGVKKEVFRRNNINLVFGPINSPRYVREMMNGPSYDELLEIIKEKKNKLNHF
jgi:hypothetical protein